MASAKDKLIIALDVDTMHEAEILVDKLRDHVGLFKIGMQLFNSEGPQVVRRINELGGRVFLDLKLHDIPNTVGQASAVLTRHRVFMFNIHTAGGSEMMKKAVEMSRKEAAAMQQDAAGTAKAGNGFQRPLVIGVTILTSINQTILEKEMGISAGLEEQVVKWARLAQDSGLDGVVASPQEIRAIRQACGKDFVVVTPGVRPEWAAANDQKRVMTPKEAVAAGASFLVVGRPITAAPDPVEAARRIVAEMEEGLPC